MMDGRVFVLVEEQSDGADPAVQRILEQARASNVAACIVSAEELTAGGFDKSQQDPMVVVLGPTLSQPLRTARRLKAAGLEGYFLFAAPASEMTELRRQLFYAAPPGAPWSLQAADSPELAQVIRRGVTAIQQRKRLRTTLDRINARLSTPPAVDRFRYRELLASDRYLVSLLKHAQDAIISLDAAGTITSWNEGAEALFRVSQSQALGASAAALLPVQNGITSALEHTASGEVVRRELVSETPAGAKYLDAVFSPIEDESRAVTGVAMIVRDVTDRKLAEEALREADLRKDEFLAVLAHELRNPLAPISNALKLMGMNGIDETQRESSRQIAVRQVQHMARLLDDLLDVSRISRGSLKLRKELVSLKAAAADGIESARPLMTAKNHALEVRLPPDRIMLDADPARLIQIVGNLLTNAAKYTAEGGRISMKVAIEDRWAVIRVKDNGIGIEQEMLPRIFEMFAQSPAGESGGTGVGLAITRKLVELHRGRIEARSEGKGRGSEFIVRLPFEEVTAEGADEPGYSAAASQATTPRRVLVVDDNVDAADLLAMTFALSGHVVRKAYDGVTALETIDTFRPHVVLLDIGMPRMDGCEVARRIRAMRRGKEIVLVAVTGWGQEQDRRRTAEAGFDEHVTKPADPSALMQLVSERTR